MKSDVEDKGERTKDKGVLKSEAGSPKLEEENNSAFGTPHSDFKEHS